MHRVIRSYQQDHFLQEVRLDLEVRRDQVSLVAHSVHPNHSFLVLQVIPSDPALLVDPFLLWLRGTRGRLAHPGDRMGRGVLEDPVARSSRARPVLRRVRRCHRLRVGPLVLGRLFLLGLPCLPVVPSLPGLQLGRLRPVDPVGQIVRVNRASRAVLEAQLLRLLPCHQIPLVFHFLRIFLAPLGIHEDLDLPVGQELQPLQIALGDLGHPEHPAPLQVRDFLDILLVRLIRVSPALQGDLDLLGDPVRLARC